MKDLTSTDVEQLKQEYGSGREAFKQRLLADPEFAFAFVEILLVMCGFEPVKKND
ncbi:MAG: hypothetical protein K5751_12990 [Treponemataceae bacterium]|nr:hypothetical protein [Treponemataceae bacterium]